MAKGVDERGGPFETGPPEKRPEIVSPDLVPSAEGRPSRAQISPSKQVDNTSDLRSVGEVGREREREVPRVVRQSPRPGGRDLDGCQRGRGIGGGARIGGMNEVLRTVAKDLLEGQRRGWSEGGDRCDVGSRGHGRGQGVRGATPIGSLDVCKTYKT